jgi:hypothetical protein
VFSSGWVAVSQRNGNRASGLGHDGRTQSNYVSAKLHDVSAVTAAAGLSSVSSDVVRHVSAGDVCHWLADHNTAVVANNNMQNMMKHAVVPVSQLAAASGPTAWRLFCGRA